MAIDVFTGRDLGVKLTASDIDGTLSGFSPCKPTLGKYIRTIKDMVSC